MDASLRHFGIMGAGQMGAGIAQVAAQHGYNVILIDRTQASLDRASGVVRNSLGRLIKKGALTEEASAEIQARITTTLDVSAFAEADLVVEAIAEKLEPKLELLRRLAAIVPETTILASNTSSISITRLAAATRHPENFMGMHFMNPVPMMTLCELIKGLATSDETVAKVTAVAQAMGKTTILAADYPGFIVNRILIPMLNEAVFALMEGLGTPEDIDSAMKLGCNQPMGPLALADLIGLDTVLSIMEVLHNGTGDSKYRPCPLLRTYVNAGWLGRKTSRGFHRYSA
ncbi:MAG: 3-hydroxybutyryl-CoA dehydrogenase [Myxococcales bacterium]|nr:3-hydroxybutyryl-CoA dehydrogenase [Myxococcales bacterium]